MPIDNQIYEEYWKLTLAWTDFNGDKFLNTLRITVNFINEHKDEEYTTELYSELQKNVQRLLNISLESVRKGINQLVKMGFVNFHLKSYHPLTTEYLNTDTNNERSLLLSKIVYSNSSFNRSVTDDSNVNEIGFLVRTLENIGTLSNKYICVIMMLNLNNYPDGYITQDELERRYNNPEIKDFVDRKYNQIGYLNNLLGKLDGISYDRQTKSYAIASEENSIVVDAEKVQRGRDSYLQRIYKRQLEEECKEIYNSELPKCMVENLTYPVLIASHIKPYMLSDNNEQFDSNNGLLLSKNIDSLFDLKYISFDDNGNIIFYKRLSDDVKDFLTDGDYKLDDRFLNDERKAFLAQHRELCIAKNQ